MKGFRMSADDRITEYYIPIEAIKYATELKFCAANLDLWFTVSCKVPDLYTSDITMLLKRLEFASSIVLAPLLVDCCKNVLTRLEGPLEFCSKFHEFEHFPPQNDLFNKIIQPDKFKYGQYWAEMNRIMSIYLKNTILIYPPLLLTDISQPGIIGFKKWFRSIMEIYDTYEENEYLLQFRSRSSTVRSSTNRHGYPTMLNASFGFFKNQIEEAKFSTSVNAIPVLLKDRLENANKKRANRS